jgi:hypothetical protein
MILDVDETVGRMQVALNRAVGADLPCVRGYAAAKARAVTHYADLIADAYAAGLLDDDEMKRELQEIEHMTRRYARALKGVASVAAEKAAKAATGVLFGAMRAGLGYAGSPLPAGLVDAV